MRKCFILSISVFLLMALLLTTCQTVNPTVTRSAPIGQPIAGGPTLIRGSFTYTNAFVVETYYVEQAVAINDMSGFIKRDKEWELPLEGQVLGYLKVDKGNKKGTFRLALPAVPEGILHNLSHGVDNGAGIQVFAVTYSPNLAGGPFSEGDDPSYGWPAYLASVKTDPENKDEVTGGKLLIWAPDDQQEFPSGFGTDGLLFTADDPLMKVPAGYSIVDLDQKPFTISRDQTPDVTLYEPADIAVKDYSGLSYKDAFDKMFQKVRKEYAFTGIPGKGPDWDTLYTQIAPLVDKAQQSQDSFAYFMALRIFIMSFRDGHTSLDGGNNQALYNRNTIIGGYGFALRELDDGSVVVVYLTDKGPAKQAEIQVGAEVTAFNGIPIRDAISQTKPLSNQSTDFGLRYEQVMMLPRCAIGSKTTVTFKNPNSASQTVQLTSIQDLDSLYATYNGGQTNENALPVEFKILPEGPGYVKINSNYDDLNLIVRLFMRALDTFKKNNVPGIIIDMRHNFGGSPLELAGFLYDQKILLGQLEYFSDKTGKFEPEGPRDKVYPNVEQYKFGKEILLVDQFCFSACEIESYGFSQVPGMLVMGQFPTAGVEAETARGDFKMPDGMEITVPTGRYTLPDGSLFLEGMGVQPAIRIPVDLESVLSGKDVVLQKAIDQIISTH
jgi:C-terminal processing protease CtpA/Prc